MGQGSLHVSQSAASAFCDQHKELLIDGESTKPHYYVFMHLKFVSFSLLMSRGLENPLKCRSWSPAVRT